MPPSLKAPVRRLLNAWNAPRRSHALKRVTRELRRAVQAGAVSPALCHDLRAVWGNPAWTADAEYLACIAARALERRGPVLECGSGLSTLVLGVIADESGTNAWSLEQDGRWHRFMSAVLDRLGIRRVALWHAPLVTCGDLVWFDLGARRLPATLMHVFCDGPSVLPQDWPEPFHGGWRAGVVPELQRCGVRFAEIVLDDADDPRCSALRRRWNALGVATRIVRTATGSLLIGRDVRGLAG